MSKYTPSKKAASPLWIVQVVFDRMIRHLCVFNLTIRHFGVFDRTIRYFVCMQVPAKQWTIVPSTLYRAHDRSGGPSVRQQSSSRSPKSGMFWLFIASCHCFSASWQMWNFFWRAATLFTNSPVSYVSKLMKSMPWSLAFSSFNFIGHRVKYTWHLPEATHTHCRLEVRISQIQNNWHVNTASLPCGNLCTHLCLEFRAWFEDRKTRDPLSYGVAHTLCDHMLETRALSNEQMLHGNARLTHSVHVLTLSVVGHVEMQHLLEYRETGCRRKRARLTRTSWIHFLI